MNNIYKILFFLFIAACNTNEIESVKQDNLRNELLKSSEKNNPTQQFVISPQPDTVITGAQGTKIYIKANSFRFKDGQEVQQPINLSLKEIYSKSEMVLNNLTTTSDGQLLESSGMINLGAKSEGKELELKDNETIRLRFKNVTDAPYMRTFIGEVDSAKINWKIDQNKEDTLVFQITEEMIYKLSYGDDAITSTTITYGVVGLDTIELNRVSSYGLEDSVDTLTSTSTPLPYYNIYTTKLNWINCDYFLNPDSTVDLHIKNYKEAFTQDYLIFEDINSIMPVRIRTDSLKTFINIPYNNEVTILSFGVKDGNYYLASKKKKINKHDEVVNLQYEKVTFKKLNREINKLD
ncbi:MAG: hypothetical protein ACNS60_03505 [Candidatus Cyclobacteriaceae bacterium M2_1C_046]